MALFLLAYRDGPTRLGHLLQLLCLVDVKSLPCFDYGFGCCPGSMSTSRFLTTEESLFIFSRWVDIRDTVKLTTLFH